MVRRMILVRNVMYVRSKCESIFKKPENAESKACRG